MAFTLAYKEPPISWEAFLEGVERRLAGKCVSGWNNSQTNSGAWAGTETVQDAIRMAREGWEEGTRQIAEQLDKLPAAEEVLLEWTLQAAGIQPCVPAFLTGDVECMWQREEEIRPERRVTIITAMGYPALIPAARVMNYGIAVTAILRSLEASGVSPALYAMEACTSTYNHGDGVYVHGVIVRDHGQPLDLAKMAFSMHPAFMRRLDFSYREQSEGLEAIGRDGYGYYAHSWRDMVREHLPECGKAVVMPNLHDLNENGLLDNVPRLIEHLRRHIESELGSAE